MCVCVCCVCVCGPRKVRCDVEAQESDAVFPLRGSESGVCSILMDLLKSTMTSLVLPVFRTRLFSGPQPGAQVLDLLPVSSLSDIRPTTSVYRVCELKGGAVRREQGEEALARFL